jgi:sugar/nucleoside kinase (ribokinase family)
MSLLVTGTIGLDTVETPYGKAEQVLGGSAAYFSFAAGLMHKPVRLVAVVGEDFPTRYLEMFRKGPIDVGGLEVRKGAKTFRWEARYLRDMNERETIRTDLNVIAEAAPTIPPQFRDSSFVFLANTHPALQRAFIGQLTQPKLIVCDTMNLWIENTREELIQTLGAVHGVVVNDGEARMLTGEDNLILAGRGILKLGPRFTVIKKGEHGAMLVTADEVFVIPAFPCTEVKDPTGAGDSFGGGMMGYLASVNRTDTAALKSALACGTCVASITIEGFSLDSLRNADRRAVMQRQEAFKAILRFE